MGEWHKCELRGQSRKKVGNAMKEAWTPQVTETVTTVDARYVSVLHSLTDVTEATVCKMDALC